MILKNSIETIPLGGTVGHSFWRWAARKWSVAPAAALVLAIAFFVSTPARASCGSPPDPRYNTAGYVSWCSCMGGSYNYQTTACTGAHGPSTRGSNQATSNSWPAQHWYCRARAKNGANGWGRYGDRGSSERRALTECDNYARGSACRLVGCTYVGGTPPSGSDNDTAAQPVTSSRQTSPQSSRSFSSDTPQQQTQQWPPPFTSMRPSTAVCGGKPCLAGQVCGPTNRCYNPSTHFYCGTKRCVKGRKYPARSACGVCGAKPSQADRVVPNALFPFAAFTCEQCYRKLKADVRFGWITHKRRAYIAEAINGYEACKQKASGNCSNADLFRNGVHGCASTKFNDEGSRACVSHVLKHDPENF